MIRWLRREKTPPPHAVPNPPRAETATPKAEHILRRLEWSVLRRLDGLLLGDYRTLMRGAGLDLADLREYQMHDDVRHIDWNVTARMQTPHVRVFTEDREMAAWFLLDLSPSVDFGSGPQRKRQVSAEFVGVLARLLTRHGNRVGALLYAAGVEKIIPARASRQHVLHLLHAMQSVQPGATTKKKLLALASQALAAQNCLNCCWRRPTPSAAARRSSWCRISSANRGGKSRSASSPRGTKWWPCA